MKKLVAPDTTKGDWGVEYYKNIDAPDHDVTGDHYRIVARIDGEHHMHVARTHGNSYGDELDARFLAGSKRATDLLAQIVNGLSSGAVEMESGEVGGNEDQEIPPHPWHEEWLHHARQALLASGYQETE